VKPTAPPPIFREWLSGDPAPAYLLYGDGAGLAGLLTRSWEGKLRGEGIPIESYRWTLEDLARESPTAAWRSPSFFSRVRIFTLPDLAEMKKGHRDEIKAYLESPEPSATLILHGTDFRQARGFSGTRNLLSDAPREEALFLARWVGVSFDALDAEIGKVLAFAGGRGEVVEEDIRAVCVARGDVDPFRLAESLVRKDGKACLSLFRRFAAAAETDDYHKLNGAVAWFLRSRIQGKGGAGGVTPRRAAEIFRTLSRIDREMKGESRLSPGQVYEIRLLSLLT
jgi:hypothetical protein